MHTNTEPAHSPYIGRFAPSPTGPLHFGSMVAAAASYLDARANNGRWLLRMEDLDKPREKPGAADDILKTLEAFGFEWDGNILYQSQRSDAYSQAAETLQQQGRLYACGCSRKDLATLASTGIEGLVYPGTCRNGLPAGKAARAWRVKVNEQTIRFEDAIQGTIRHQLTTDIGDFVLKRADGIFAYQLAVVVDDNEQGITHIVRGADLLNSTTRQIFLQQLLDLNTPQYAHIPLATHADGKKLSKQTHAKAVNPAQAKQTLLQAFTFLGLSVPRGIQHESLNAIWNWAIQNWQLVQIPKCYMIQLETIIVVPSDY